MIAAWFFVASLAVWPGQLQVSTAQGLKRIDLIQWKGEGPLVPLGALARALS